MPTHRRNEFLDADLSSDNGSLGYDSEQDAGADSRTAGLTSHRSKRPRLSPTLSDAGREEEGAEVEATGDSPPRKKQPGPAPKRGANRTADSIPIQTPSTTTSPPLPTTTSAITTTTTTKKSKPPSKPGVIYLSRIPPYMPPHLVRTHLSAHGPITSIFLTPEPPSHRALRLKHSGNKKRTYVDGWIEFASHKHARACVDAINGRTVGGKKGSWYRDDVWNAKYLRGFTWGDLMEGVRVEEREREERVRVGVARDKREREAFLRSVEGSKVERTRREKRERRQGKEREGVVDAVGVDPMDERKMEKKGTEAGGRERGEQRRFRQSDVKAIERGNAERPDEVNRVLSKIF